MNFFKNQKVGSQTDSKLNKDTQQEYLALDELIDNVYINSKLSKEEYEITSPIYLNISEILNKFSEYYDLETNTIQHGSYKLNTIMMYPSKQNDIDIDIGITINNLPRDVTPQQIKKLLFNFLQKNKGILKYHTIEQKSCAVTLKFPNEKIHVDIVVYRMNGLNQEVAYKNNWIHEEKNNQYEILKGITSNNNNVKKLICFLKFIYKNANFYEGYTLSSIIITEIVTQDYTDKLNEYIYKNYPKCTNLIKFSQKKSTHHK